MIVKTAIYCGIHGANRPSFYATPIAWAAAEFTQSLIDDAGDIVRRQTGMIVASDECSLSTIRDLSRTAARGMISPLRFAGASPSIVAGLPCLQQGLRGPALALTMSPDHASGAILALITYWIRDTNVASVIAITHYRQGERHLFKGLITSAAGDGLREHVLRLCNPHADGVA